MHNLASRPQDSRRVPFWLDSYSDVVRATHRLDLLNDARKQVHLSISGVVHHDKVANSKRVPGRSQHVDTSIMTLLASAQKRRRACTGRQP